MPTDPDRTNIPIKRKNYKILLKAKVQRAAKVGRHITWDEFLLGLVKKK